MLHERPPALGTYGSANTGNGTWDAWAKRTTRRACSVRAGIFRNRYTGSWVGMVYAHGLLHRVAVRPTHADAVRELDEYIHQRLVLTSGQAVEVGE